MKITKILIGLLIFWLTIVSIWFSQKFTLDEGGEFEIDYSKFREHLENKEIEKAFIEDKEFHGELHVEAIDKEKDVSYSRFKTTLPEAPDDETAGKWSREYNVVLEFKAISNEWWNYIFQLLPWILFGSVPTILVGLILILIRRRKRK